MACKADLYWCRPWRSNSIVGTGSNAKAGTRKIRVPVADVAELIGDTEQVVRKHYAKWVPGRQARLTKILREAFEDKPKPKLVVLPGRRRSSGA